MMQNLLFKNWIILSYLLEPVQEWGEFSKYVYSVPNLLKSLLKTQMQYSRVIFIHRMNFDKGYLAESAYTS